MKTLDCKGCGAMLDVGALKPGTEFACGGCGAMLRVPAAAKAPARRREPSAAMAAARASRTPLLVGGIAVGVLAVVGAVFALKPSSPPPPPPEPLPALGPGATKKKEPEKVLPPEEAAWAAAKTESERVALADLRAAESRASDDASKAAFEFFAGKNRKDLGRRVATARMESDPDSAWARGILGFTDERAPIQELAANKDLASDPIPEWERLRKRVDEKRTWVESGPEKAAMDADIAAARKHLAQISDPWRKEMRAVVKQVRDDPAFRWIDSIDHRAIPPYLVLAQVQKDEMRHSTKNVLDNHSKFFQCLTGEFLRIMGEAGLPTPTLAEMGNPVLKAFVFIDRGNFDKWHVEQRWPKERLRGIRAYYARPSNQFMMMYDTGAPTGTQDEDTCTAFHEATHQLVHYYKRYYRTLEDRKKDPKAPEVHLLDDRLDNEPHWFQEGFAEFFGGADRISSQTGEWRLFRPHKARLREWADPFMRKAPQWTLEEVLRMPHSTALRLQAERKWPGHGVELASLYYAQAWALNHFLYFGKDGRYRERYLKVVNEEMRSNSGYEMFMREMEAGEGEDRADFLAVLEKQWKEYQAELVRK